MNEILLELAQALNCLENIVCNGYANHANLARAMELVSSAHRQVSAEAQKQTEDKGDA